MIDAPTSRFQELVAMVDVRSKPIPPPPSRTEAEEDRLALEYWILESEGPDALERYQARLRLTGSLICPIIEGAGR
jgi:hypothetical protein